MFKKNNDKSTKVTVAYEVSGSKLQSLLFPFIKKTFKKWNHIIWLEDLPLKLRRQKALEYGFVDWIGLPLSLDERIDKSKEYICEIPVTKSRGIFEMNHPFTIVD